MTSHEDHERELARATLGFDCLFSNQLVEARATFARADSPFHLLGLGACAFLEAALGMETELMSEASRCLALSKANAEKRQKAAKGAKGASRFPPGLEFEVLHADAILLLGLTHALSESYMGYIQCMYALNSAHSKFAKLYKTVYPDGLSAYRTPASTPPPSRKTSNPSFQLAASSPVSLHPSQPQPKNGFFGRFSGSSPSLKPPQTTVEAKDVPDSPIEQLIMTGTAFGFGMFNLVFSLLPAKIRGVVGFLGYQHDRKLALQALAVSATKDDVHSVFSSLVLMTYHGVILLLAGWQADEEHILRQYAAVLDKVEARYPAGALWILNRAKMYRMARETDKAIEVLQKGLSPDKPHSFAQADTLLIFELAWTMLSQRRFEEAAHLFVRITELNSWSHATYYFIAAGCHFSMGDHGKAQALLDAVPALLEKRKLVGKEMPTETFIRKKLDFYKAKQKRRGGEAGQYVEAIKISPAEEISIFWNNHGRISTSIATLSITTLASLSPPVSISTPLIPSPSASALSPGTPPDLDTADELAVRALLLGILHRVAGEHAPARAFLQDAHARHAKIETSTWVPGVAVFEEAVLDLKAAGGAGGESEKGKGLGGEEARRAWAPVLKGVQEKLDRALGLSTNTDLSSRLDSRINMLKDEIATKREMLGIA